jgi:peptide deformylase
MLSTDALKIWRRQSLDGRDACEVRAGKDADSVLPGLFAMAKDDKQGCCDYPCDPVMVRPLSLRFYPDPLLRGLCFPVGRFDSWLSDLLADMLELMRAHEGVGLAAPQVGITKRLFVAEIQGCSMCLVNPVITARSGSDRMDEGCLSLPGVSVDVQRDWQIEVQGFDAQGRRQTHRVEGLWARVMQHEIDHLDGVLICDHKKLHRCV